MKEDLPGFPDSVLSRAIAVAVAWLIIEVELVTLAMGGVSDYGFGRLLGVNAMALGATWLTFRRRAAPSVWLMGWPTSDTCSRSAWSARSGVPGSWSKGHDPEPAMRL